MTDNIGPDAGWVVTPKGSAFTLTPAFDPQITQYAVRIPESAYSAEDDTHANGPRITAVVASDAADPVTFLVTGTRLGGETRTPKAAPVRPETHPGGEDEGNGPWASGPWGTPVGYTWVDVKVTAADGTTTKTYTVKVEYGTAGDPRNVKLTPGDKQLTLTWEHPASGTGLNYFVRWRKAGTTAWLNPGQRGQIGSVITGPEGGAWLGSGREKSFTIRGLENGVEYEAQLQVLFGGGRSYRESGIPDDRKDDWLTSGWVSAKGTPVIILTITPTSPTRVYGGTDDLSYTVGGLASGDAAASVVTGVLARAAGDDAGTYAFNLSGLSIASAYASKYGLPSAPSVANYTITAKPVTYTSTAADKVYDGTTDAPSVLGGSFATGDVLSGDTVTVSGGSYASADVGAGLAVTGMSLGGADAGNYTATFSVTGDVTAKPITAISGVTVNSRAADGTTTATFDTSSASGTGVVSAELADFRAGGLQVSGSFPAVAAGTHAVSVTYSLQDQGSFKAGNYSLSVTTATLSGEITTAATDAVVVRASCAPVGQDDDTDDPTLIDISTLAQLDAMRWDADGDGVSDRANNAAAYAAAGLGCPDGGCVGYELTADLDFDTNGNGHSDAGDTYWHGGAGWKPLFSSGFKAVFDGNGHTISNLYVNGSDPRVGLFAMVDPGGVIRNVGLESVDVTGASSVAAGLVGNNKGTVIDSYVTGSVSGARIAGGLAGWTGTSSRVIASYSTASVSGTESVGGLVGDNVGAIIAGCAAGDVSGAGAVQSIGGLAGASDVPGYVIASHAAGDVSVPADGSYAGGLIGSNRAPVTASYSVGAVSGGGSYVDELIGRNSGKVTASYSDTDADLQAPTGYTGIYAGWNVDLDGDGNADDPWDFGTSSEYPTLQYSGLAEAAVAETTGTTDYDGDGDGLIEISSLAQLNAIRWDVNGDGGPNLADYAAGYATAFPDAATGMGCPSTGCVGYELTADLDFDTNDNGRADAGDDYWNGGLGWMPIQDDGLGYRAVLEGNGHTISNLYINNRIKSAHIGLFRSLIHPAEVRNLGLESVSVSATLYNSTAGALVGENGGTVSGSYMTGAVSGGYAAGGLVGENIRFGVVAGSYAAGRVSGNGWDVGGLVGYNDGRIIASYAVGPVSGGGENVGGLVGYNNGRIIASYAAGAVSGGGENVGGLIGVNVWEVRLGYWDTETSGRSDSAAGMGKTTAELQTPTGYAGIYAAWNVDLDGDGSADDPWDFGTSGQYPVLKGAGPSVSGQRGQGEPEEQQQQQQQSAAAKTFSVTATASAAEGGNAALTITLSEDAPAGGVAFTVTAGYGGGATATAADVGSITSPVTVTAGNDTLQIAIPTAADTVDEDDETFTVTVAATASGWAKEGDGKDTATVTITDDDTAGVTATPATLNVSEDGSATYTVVLDSRPTASVTVTATSSDTGALSVAPASYTFTSTDWNTPQTFTVSGVADADRDDESVTIGHSVTSSDAKYGGISVDDASVAVADTTPAPAASCPEETEPPVAGQKEPYNVCVTPGDGTLTVTWTLATRPGVADEDILHALRWSQVSGVWANPPEPTGSAENGVVVEGGVTSYTITGLTNDVATGVFVRSFAGNSYSERSERSSKWVRVKGENTTPKAAG